MRKLIESRIEYLNKRIKEISRCYQIPGTLYTDLNNLNIKRNEFEISVLKWLLKILPMIF